MSIHERRLRGSHDALDALRKLRGDAPAVLLDAPAAADDPTGARRPVRVLFDPFAIVAVPAGSDRAPAALDPLARLFEEIAPYSGTTTCGVERRGGAAGFLGYDLGRHFERLPATAALDTSMPDLWFAMFDRGLEIDPSSGAATLFVEELPGRALEASPGEILDRAERALERDLPPLRGFDAGALESNFTADEYRAAVERVREYILDGDVYQVNLSQRFTAPFSGDAFAVAARLRSISPAPHGAIVAAPEFTLLSASPESFLEKRGDVVVTRPIKGTRPRGADAADDERLIADLRGATKDGAELAMIVDLERNDLGRVARFGSVEVVEAGRIERHPTVLHKVATVRARLADGVGGEDLLRATFPGGSITGCPKIRAMGVIEELERVRRGVFTGAIGFLGFGGDLSLNIAIRTLVHEAGRIHFHVGGGIVLDSIPDAEYRETLVKGGALARALGRDRLGPPDCAR